MRPLQMLLYVSVLFTLVGCDHGDVPLSAAISLSPHRQLVSDIWIKRWFDYDYGIDVRLDKEFVLLKDVGCAEKRNCSKGIPIPLYWSLKRKSDGITVASGRKTMWTGSLLGEVGRFNVPRGQYIFQIEAEHDVPELANVNLDILIYEVVK